MQNLSAEKLREIPVDNLQGCGGTKAGVVAQGGELHFRGGRGGEVKFQISGVEASDPLLGTQRRRSPRSRSPGTDILSGGFDAEYGNALSGVVNVSTREGTDRFGGEVRWDTDRYGDPTKTFDNFDRIPSGSAGPRRSRTSRTSRPTKARSATPTCARRSPSRPRRCSTSSSSATGSRTS
jgi:hypothetical protein